MKQRGDARLIKISGAPVRDATDRAGEVTIVYHDHAVRVKWEDGSETRVPISTLTLDRAALLERHNAFARLGGIRGLLLWMDARICGFDKQCASDEYTDLDAVWTLLYELRDEARRANFIATTVQRAADARRSTLPYTIQNFLQ